MPRREMFNNLNKYMSINKKKTKQNSNKNPKPQQQ